MILDAIHRLANHRESLSREEARAVMTQVLAGECTEAQIAALEAEIASDEESLANFVSAEESMRISTQLEKRRTQLSALLSEWEETSQEA